MGSWSSTSLVAGGEICPERTLELLKKKLKESKEFADYCEKRYLVYDELDDDSVTEWIDVVYDYVKKDLGKDEMLTLIVKRFRLVQSTVEGVDGIVYNLSMMPDHARLSSVPKRLRDKRTSTCWQAFQEYFGLCDFDDCTLYGASYVSL